MVSFSTARVVDGFPLSFITVCNALSSVARHSLRRYLISQQKSFYQSPDSLIAEWRVLSFFMYEGRKELKRYSRIFCCLANHAVRLELINDLSTDCSIMSLRRFTALCGPVKLILSDRGTKFIDASKDMAKALDEMIDLPAKDYLKSKCCTFMFNVSSASHMCGSWERLIRTVRDVKGILIDICIKHSVIWAHDYCKFKDSHDHSADTLLNSWTTTVEF